MSSVKIVSLLVVLVGLACGPSVTSRDDGGASPPDADPAQPDASDLDAPTRECAQASYEAEQSPAALLVVLDRSSSMAQQNKWVFAAQAIVQALDQDVFDSLSVGLYVAPSGNVAGPACIFNLPVACQAPPFPQIPLELAGSLKSGDASGVRRDIKDWLTFNTPDAGIGDATPMYAALQAAIGSLQAWPEDGKRMLLVVTDGTLSCNEFSSRPGFGDCNGCVRDWEDPRNLAQLLGDANSDPTRPIESFVVGVPGADTYDATGCDYPPYHMRLALSAIAHAGSPSHTPAACDGTSFTPAGGDPTLSCHFDMTQGGFSTTALADTISLIRGQATGCVFELPEPPDNQVINPDEVNVEYTIDGVVVSLARRSDPSDMCTTVPCWDYTADGDIELIGVACNDIHGASSVQVRIVVGCETIVL